ncbi:UDP-N-acetylmuramoyl-tripeptide--D-alanyl-D-alanine ligase [Vreelandella malpeensis]|uniref:UDP-N-acetylmuramoyl-tripeptide--D-alanyl-D-alanine ligase n=1 Tax=Vreelandella malpeensis TaxID=1172368 RepID=A0ABS8DQP4_9GAMM|nr:UDP-N-acetylmuramoyl-tripeptide--D-alanyl-D-alanine ligase [Halomonas malpeensis]
MARFPGSKSLLQARRAQQGRTGRSAQPAFRVPVVDKRTRVDAGQRLPLAQMLTRARQALVERLAAEADAPLRVFVSVTDGTRRARVASERGAPSSDALWQRLEDRLEEHYALDAPVRWLRLDWAHDVTAHTWESLAATLSRHKRNYFRRGIALDPGLQHAFLEQELNANAMLYAGSRVASAELNPGNFRRYARERFGATFEVDFNPRQRVYTFATDALLIEPGQSPRPLQGYRSGQQGRHTGRRVIETLTPAGTRALIDRASAFLAAQVEPDGRFVYGIHPCFDRDVAGYNTLRHASSIYSMLEAWEVNQSAVLKDAIDRALGRLTTTFLKRFEHRGERVTYLLEANGEIKLGGSGVTLLALAKYTELTGDEQYLPVMEELALGIRQLQLESGGFDHVLNAADLSVKERFRIIYYDGEAAFGLMRLFGLTKDPRWLEVVERAFKYFIAQEHWRAHDHWLSYCVNELTLYRPEERYYRFGLQNVAGYLDFVEERITTFPTLLELMMAAHKMITRLQAVPEYRHLLELIDIERFYRALEKRAHYLLNGHFWPEFAMYFKRPERIVGSFFIRHHSFRVRIDDVEHYLSGFVAYLCHYLQAPTPRLATLVTSREEEQWRRDDIERAVEGEWLVAPASNRWQATGLSFHLKTMAAGHAVALRRVGAGSGRGLPIDNLVRLPFTPQLLLADDSHEAAELAALGMPVYRVADIDQAVLAMGRYARQKLTGRVIGVTGSAGKTTLVALLEALLRPWGDVGATTHSANLPHGIAWTLASVPWQAPYQVIEMAIGRMRQNSALARPDVAVFLNAGPAHLEYHESVEQVAVRKSRIFESMTAGSVAVINRDMEQWSIVHAAAQRHGLLILSFGVHPDATVRWVDPEEMATFVIDYPGERVKLAMDGQGAHWAMNVLAAFGVLLALGLSPRDVLPFVSRVAPPEGRGRHRRIAWRGGNIELLDDAYNANPLSMKAMLAQAQGVQARRKHLVLADMLELGAQSPDYHRALVEPILASGAHSVWLLGEQMQALEPLLEKSVPRVASFPSRSALAQRLREALEPDDWVAFKGSNKFGLSELARRLSEA